jgi:hypothetical protein
MTCINAAQRDVVDYVNQKVAMVNQLISKHQIALPQT